MWHIMQETFYDLGLLPSRDRADTMDRFTWGHSSHSSCRPQMHCHPREPPESLFVQTSISFSSLRSVRPKVLRLSTCKFTFGEIHFSKAYLLKQFNLNATVEREISVRTHLLTEPSDPLRIICIWNNNKMIKMKTLFISPKEHHKASPSHYFCSLCLDSWWFLLSHSCFYLSASTQVHGVNSSV